MANIAKALAMLAGGNSVGDDFFETVTAAMVEGLDCRWAGVSYLSDDGKSVKNMALAGDDSPFGLGRISLEGTPAQSLYADLSSGPLYLGEDMTTLFPAFQERLVIAVHGYGASLFQNANGEPAGHLFFLDDRAVERGAEAWEFLDLLTGRVAAEFSRRGGFGNADWLDALVDGTNTGLVVTDVEGRILQANTTYANWSGLRSGSEIVGSTVKDWIAPESWPMNQRAIAKLLRDGIVDEYESLLIDRNGKRREIAVVANIERTPAGVRFVALMRDIEKRKMAEKARLKSEARFRNLIEGSLEAVLIADTQMRSLFVNPAAAVMFGYDGPDEMVALDSNRSLAAPHEMAGLLEWRQQILAGEEADIEREVEGRRKDGSPIWLRVMARLVDWDGQPGVQSTMLDITERHRAAEAQAEMDARFQAILDNVPVSMALKDEQGRYLLINKWMEQQTGWSQEALRGNAIHEAIESTLAVDVAEVDREVLRTGKPDTREIVSALSPTPKIIRSTRFPIFGKDGQATGTGVFSLDITEQRQAETALRESEARLNAIIENAPFSVILKDGEGRYVTINRQAEDWIDITMEKAVGNLPSAIYPREVGDRERSRDLQVLNEGRIIRYEAAGKGKYSGHTFLATKFPILTVSGKPTGVGSIVSDITDRKNNEEVLLRQMERAEESSDAKTRFLAVASHDLRQPLHSMELMLEILARQITDPGQQELVSDIAQAASIAAGLLNPLLDYSRLEAGMEVPEIGDFAVATLLRDMEVGFRSQAEVAGLELRIMPCDAVIRSDPVLLARIVSNFLSNAIRYSEEGRLLLGCRPQGNVLRIEVWDTGPGIEGEHLSAIFEEFHQIESTRRDRDKGLGLGLAIVKAQATLLQHEIRVRSRPGQGSTFAIEVPLVRRSSALESVAPTMAGEPAELESLSGLRMMILEDNAAILRATKALLERWGCYVAAATSRDEAMQVITTETAMFDLLIADYHLDKDNNGVDTVVQMQDQLDYDVPAIIVTADISNDSLQHATNNGFPLLQKPFRPAALRAAIADIIFDQTETL